ncbi:MAG: hypothetical protein L0Y44_15150 [Phycisphaerales bacterium]|nr:hypothetical protein [Phycisphaerales bacterium]MCI0631980.1 hypothetical protein [Phycisphaerales bacterium]MCI0675959.1 hypothetical protein [Phycisphaerales bacterium]
MWLLAETTDDGWTPGIGDPTFMGWFTVAAYLITAGLCWRAWRAARARQLRPAAAGNRSAWRNGPAEPNPRRFWLSLAIVFALLAVNKQLDLQSWFTAVGREIAKRGGWYSDRQFVQTWFVVTLAIIGAVGMAMLIWSMRKHMREYGLALAGTLFLAVFIIVRAASFHHVDELLDWGILGLNMNWILELGGIACVATGAALNGRPGARKPPPIELPKSRPVQPRVAAHRESFRWMVERLRDRA